MGKGFDRFAYRERIGSPHVVSRIGATYGCNPYATVKKERAESATETRTDVSTGNLLAELGLEGCASPTRAAMTIRASAPVRPIVPVEDKTALAAEAGRAAFRRMCAAAKAARQQRGAAKAQARALAALEGF